ncbi:MAG: hypothetical protein II901_04735 [Paludibacteraceae bacterium]|nr:hypothetical protein [Paludibacteraceae bacterium]
MEEVIKYFESLEARIAALEAQVEELKNRPEPEPKVVEKVVEVEKIVEKPVEVIKEVVVEKPVVVAAPVVEPKLPAEPQPEQKPEQKPESKPEPEQPKEVVSPNASIYGKAVDDIRQAISLGDRFLYQRELFNQNAELMQRTLTELNALSSFDEAMEYISRFHWDAESSTYQQFIVTLHRRFG